MSDRSRGDNDDIECDLVILDSEPCKVPSLLSICRACIMRSIGIHRVQQVSKLPIPRMIKQYLLTFTIPGDFNLEGIYMNYHFAFVGHRHSNKHQIHPGEFTIDGSRVLVKSLKTDVDKSNLSICEAERNQWKSACHDGLMNCLFGLTDIRNSRLCYVLEFPVIDLEDVILKCYVARYVIPEYLIWLSLLQISEVLLYLTSMHINCLELCYSKHIVIDATGRLKLENKLLYLPPPQVPDPITILLMAPEEKLGMAKVNTISWKVGFVIRELMSTELTPDVPKSFLPIVGVPFYRSLSANLMPSSSGKFSGDIQKIPGHSGGPAGLRTPLSSSENYLVDVPRKESGSRRSNYSHLLVNLADRCQDAFEQKRPSLVDLEAHAQYNVNTMSKCFDGPRNFLQLDHIMEVCNI